MLFRPSSNTLLRIGLWSLAVVPIAVLTAATMLSHSQFNTHVGEPVEQDVPFSHRHHVLELGLDCRYCHTSVEKSPFAGIPPTKTCMSCHSMIWTDSALLKPVRDSWKNKTPLVWSRVNSLPKFVYFDHSIHIARGVSCNTCHGPVQDMTLTWRQQEFTMVWCLNCHRHPERFLTQVSPKTSLRNQVFHLYWKLQSNAPLTPAEQGWVTGKGETFNGDVRSGEDVVRAKGVRKAELTDCNVCHR